MNPSGGSYARGCAYDFATRQAVVKLASQKPAPSHTKIATVLGVSRQWVDKILKWHNTGEPIIERPSGGPNNVVITDVEQEYLEFLVISRTCTTDHEYWARLYQDLGWCGALSTVRNALNRAQCNLRVNNNVPLDKYTLELSLIHI